MKNTLFVFTLAAACLVPPALQASSTRFDYSGQLDVSGVGPFGTFDFRFSLYGSPGNNDPVGSSIQSNAVIVANGMFTVPLDFGSVFDGSDRWLEIEVRTNMSNPPQFTILTPRVQIASIPYAITAKSLSSDLPASQITGTLDPGQLPASVAQLDGNPVFTGSVSFNTPANTTPFTVANSVRVSNLNADLLDGFDSASFWKLLGNSGTDPNVNFLGTIDNTNLTIRVNSLAALRLFPDQTVRNDLGSAPPEPFPASPNLVGGYGGNLISVDARGATIAGGGGLYDHVFHDTSPGWNEIGQAGDFSFIGSGSANYVKGPHNSIVGGHYNRINDANYSVIAGGGENLILAPVDAGAIVAGVGNTLSNLADTAFIGAGHNNLATNTAAFIGAGGFILAGGAYSVAAGGSNNLATGFASSVPGGADNRALGEYSFAAGQGAQAGHDRTFVWNSLQNSPFASTAPNQFLIRANGGVGINLNNPSEALDVNGNVKATAFIGDGQQLTGIIATIADGSITTPKLANLAVTTAKIGDDQVTTVKIPNSAITTPKLLDGAVTQQKLAAGVPSSGQVLSYIGSALAWATPPSSGSGWSLSGDTVVGGNFLGSTNNSTVELRANNLTALRITTGGNFGTSNPNIIGGAASSLITAGSSGSVIGGGFNDSITANNSTIAGGRDNQIQSGATESTISGGQGNIVHLSATSATVGGGNGNEIYTINSTISGGTGNKILGQASTIGGGNLNMVSNASYATIAGGANNLLLGVNSGVIGGGNGNVISNSSGSSASYATIAGGRNNFIHDGSAGSAIGGGESNEIDSYPNDVTSMHGTIAGGFGNKIRMNSRWSSIGGGFSNVIEPDGSGFNSSVISGGAGNVIKDNAYFSVITGGHQNEIGTNANRSTLGGGEGNKIGTLASFSVIAAGDQNTIQSSSHHSTISGGQSNVIPNSVSWSTIAGGVYNTNGGAAAVIGGGNLNSIGPVGLFATIPGGFSNSINGSYSFAAGQQAKALHNATFVWSDGNRGNSFGSTTANQFLISATNGVGINTNVTAGFSLTVSGDTRITGTTRSGSESGTSQLPSPAGLVTRRINSSSAALNQVVARNDHVTLERDGSNGGMIIRYPAGAYRQAITCTAMTSAGSLINYYNTLVSPGVSSALAIFSGATDVVQFHCTFGDPLNEGHHTEVNLIREGLDFHWVGTLTSTYNQ
jgi:hypothetical protein